MSRTLASAVSHSCCARAVQAQSTLEAIHVQGFFAKHLRQSAGGQTAGQLHFPQAVLGVAEALTEIRVEWVAGADVGNAPPIADDLYRRGQPSETYLAVQLRQWTPQQVPKGTRGHRARCPGRNAQ